MTTTRVLEIALVAVLGAILYALVGARLVSGIVGDTASSLDPRKEHVRLRGFGPDSFIILDIPRYYLPSNFSSQEASSKKNWSVQICTSWPSLEPYGLRYGYSKGNCPDEWPSTIQISIWAGGLRATRLYLANILRKGEGTYAFGKDSLSGLLTFQTLQPDYSDKVFIIDQGKIDIEQIDFLATCAFYADNPRCAVHLTWRDHYRVTALFPYSDRANWRDNSIKIMRFLDAFVADEK